MSEELQKTGQTEVAPSYIEDSIDGTEHITRQDVSVPAIKLAQAMSPEATDGDPKQIEGLKPGMFFNSLTREVYGKGPIRIAIIRADPPRYVEFIPRNQGGGVKDPNVPASDPRTQFTTDPVSGKSVPPIATKFYDYVVVRLDTMEPVAMSLKSMALKPAKLLNALVKLSGKAIYGRVYSLTSIPERNAKGPYANWQFVPAGWPTQEEYAFLKAAHMNFKDRDLNLEREEEPEVSEAAEPSDHADTSFDPRAM